MGVSSRILIIAVLLVLGVPRLLGESLAVGSPRALVAAAPVFVPTHSGATSTSSLPAMPSTIPTAPASQTPAAEEGVVKNSSLEPQKSDDGLPHVFKPESLHDSPPLAFDEINVSSRAALVNILCTPLGSAANPSSGSGVFFTPQLILTNAHVAQYVFLAQMGLFDASCVARTGAPAMPRYALRVVHLSASWVEEHAADIRTRTRLGTGEHDWAVLLATPLPSSLPTATPLPFDTRAGAAFVGDPILAAAYPAEFSGTIIMQTQLHPSSAVTVIDRLMTFATSSVDVVSIGSSIAAQAGSSGGAVVNQWGKLVGIITTTSEGATTGDRSLRALTLDYIQRDMKQEIGRGLEELAGLDPFNLADTFEAENALILRDVFMHPTRQE